MANASRSRRSRVEWPGWAGPLQGGAALEAPVGADAEDGTLHDVLADSGAEDPSMVAAREIDWAELVVKFRVAKAAKDAILKAKK